MDTVNGFGVIDCKYCRFKHIVPIPTCEKLESVYRHEYYTKEKPLYLKHYREDLDWWNMTYGDHYDTFEEHLSKDRRRILDIGSGPGFFLLCGKKRGWDTVGMEPSAKAASYSRRLGLRIIERFLTEESVEELGKFDVIHMSEVIEHIPDPMRMMRIIKKMLSPGGLICIVAPNDYNPFQYALRKECKYKPWWIAPPYHINYFDFKSLESLIKRSGFEILLQEASFPIDIFLLMGDKYVGNDKLGRWCHRKRKKFETNLHKAGLKAVKRGLYKLMAKEGIGREVIIVGRIKRQKKRLK